MPLPLILGAGAAWLLFREKEEPASDAAIGTGLKRKRVTNVAREQAELAASVGQPPLTVSDGRYGYVPARPGRPGGLGNTPALGQQPDEGPCRCRGCGCSGAPHTQVDIFRRIKGKAVGVSDATLATVPRRGG